MNVEEWLGKDNQLGIDIWNKKYRCNNESFDDWLDRVTGGNEEVKKLIVEHKFLYGGRILANRGLTSGRKITYSNCFHGDTKILTKDGVKPLKDLVDHDIKVLSKNAWRDATVRSFGVQPVVELTVRSGTSYRTYKVTPDHIWYAKENEKDNYDEFKTSELKPGMVLRTEVMKCYRTYKPSPFGVAHGFFYGDGDHTGVSRRVNFCGDKSELIPYFTPDTVGESDDVLTICGIPKIFWGKPALDETPSYLYGWLAGYFAADGSVDRRGSCVICSSKREDLEFVQDVLCVLGIPSNQIRVQHRISNLTGEEGDVFILSLSRKYLNESFFVRTVHRERFLATKVKENVQKWVVDSVSNDGESCEVFCAVEPEAHSFALDSNILTHNCYVVTPPEDNIESIFDCARNLARTYSYGGGCGVDISRLAPRGATIHNAAKTTSGSVSFMDLYSLVTGLIGQAGRRGALMISLSCEHPDLEEFIEVKNNLDKVLFANISIRVTDAFMEAVTGRGKVPEDTSFRLHFTREETGEVIEKVVDAREVFAKLAESNWSSAEPGILFWDTIKNWNLLSGTEEFEYAGVNPCAEEPLPSWGSCLLSSINLSEFVENPFTSNAYFNMDEFGDAVEIVTVEMNKVLDEGLPLHPLAEQRESVNKWRQIGVGVMGVADMLIKLGIRYGSTGPNSSISIIKDIGETMLNRAMQASAHLAAIDGPYPGLKSISDITSTMFFGANTTNETAELVNKYGLRNSQLLTIAPTGSISTMLNVSGGMEPLFAISYDRTTKTLHGDKDVTYKVFSGIVQQYLDETGADSENLPDYFVTSHQLNYKERIDVQAAWQRYIDASISSTINLPEETTVEQVADLYMYAWRRGLKGVTAYRDNCNRKAILKEDKENDETENVGEFEIPRGIVMDVPERQTCEQFRVRTACGSMYVQVGLDDDGNIVNCHTSVGDGGCRCSTEATSRMMSLAIRSGAPIEKVISQLRKAKNCPAWQRAVGSGKKLSKGTSCPSAIANVLETLLKEQEALAAEMEDMNNEPAIPEAKHEKEVIKEPELQRDEYDKLVEQNICPDCRGQLTRKEGCISCMSCGWSKCL